MNKYIYISPASPTDALPNWNHVTWPLSLSLSLSIHLIYSDLYISSHLRAPEMLYIYIYINKYIYIYIHIYIYINMLFAPASPTDALPSSQTTSHGRVARRRPSASRAQQRRPKDRYRRGEMMMIYIHRYYVYR